MKLRQNLKRAGRRLTALVLVLVLALGVGGLAGASPLRDITNFDSLGLLGSLIFEGATADGYETTIVVTDPTAARTITLPNASGTVALNPAAGSWEFEGATANAFETTLTVTDPTADRTVTLPDAGGTVMLSALATNAADAANSVTGGSNGLIFEGATANSYETTVAPTDATADRTLTLPDATGTVALTSQAVDMTLTADPTGGNAGAKTEYIGLPRVALVGLGAGTDATAAGKTLALIDDTPDGEFAAHDADTTVSADAAVYKTGTKSLEVVFTTAADAGDGAHDGIVADFSSDESVGLHFYCDTTLAAGDVILDFTDDGGARTFNLPAYATANTWQWAEINIGATPDADKNTITDVSIELSAAGAVKAAAGEFTCFFDTAYKWDATEEEALTKAILQDGVLSVVNTTAGITLVEGTDFFVHYEATVDFIVWITKQDGATSVVALVAY